MAARTGLPAHAARAAAPAGGRRLEAVQQVFNLRQVVVHPTDMAARTVDQVNSNAPDYTAPSVREQGKEVLVVVLQMVASPDERALMLHVPALMAWSRGSCSYIGVCNSEGDHQAAYGGQLSLNPITLCQKSLHWGWLSRASERSLPRPAWRQLRRVRMGILRRVSR